MKIQKVAVTQFRCNFCLDWHVSKHSLQPPSSLNLCEGCFSKAKTSSSFKVLDPIELEVYEIRLKKTGLPSDECRSVQARELVELVEFYERNGPGQTENLSRYIVETDGVQGQLFQNNEPFRDFLNKIYRDELDRVEAIWTSALQQLNQATKLIENHRNFIKQNLQTYHYDLVKDEARLFNSEECVKRLQSIKDQASSALNLQLDKLKQSFQANPDKFFNSNFNLADTVDASLELSFLPEESLLGKLQSAKKPIESSIQKPHTPHILDTPYMQNDDKENDRVHVQCQGQSLSESKPPKLQEVAGRQTCAVRKKQIDERVSLISYYEHFDFTCLKKWPRDKIVELLNRRDNIPKGYKPDDQRPTIRRLFPERVMASQICQALDQTYIGQNMLQLINYPTQSIEFLSYLEMLKWNPRIELVKFVKVGLTDENFNLLLCYVERAEKVNSLVVSNNQLTEHSLRILSNFARQNQQLKTVYMGKNHISQHRSKLALQELRAMGLSVYV